MDERSAALGFALFSGIGPIRFTQLVTSFGSAENAWSVSQKALQEYGLSKALTEKFIAFRQSLDLHSYLEKLAKKDISFICQTDSGYPPLLLNIPNPPIVLFYQGSFDFTFPGNQQTIAIVGSRKVTEYGKQVTKQFTRELVDAGCIIVSGLALGVDSIAHAETLAAGGKTIAVLGCGVDICYPREHLRLYEAIIAHGGMIVSEYALGQEPTRGSFPARNRIISGLSRGVLVTEGAMDSGSLITAKEANKQGRPVFAIPGSIHSSLSQGPYELIKKGGVLVTRAQDILERLGMNRGSPASLKLLRAKGDTQEEQMILDLLLEESLSVDDLVRQTGIAASALGGILSVMELKGTISSSEGIISIIS